jgi:TolB protein
MASASAPYFFVSYSREDVSLQQRIVAELRERGLNIWVDIENLIPGSPAWEREIERSIRGAEGIIVLLSPDSNDSEWVRREISFAEQNEKRIFPVLISGEEDDSIPLRLSDHQRVDLRTNFQNGMDEFANALKHHLGVTAVIKRKKQATKPPVSIPAVDLKKFILPGLIALIGLACIGGLALAARFIYAAFNNSPTETASVLNSPTAPPNSDPVLTETSVVIDTSLDEPTGKIVFTCNIQGDEVCIINADGSGFQRLTNSPLANFNASLSPDGKSIVYVVKQGENSEIWEWILDNGQTKKLTDLKKYVSAPEISPDNQYILFTYRSGQNNSQIWMMNRDGTNPHKWYSASGQDAHDATWSPDGTKVLFARGRNNTNKLYIMDLGGGDPQEVNAIIDTRGHSDWSLGNLITLDMGGEFMHEIYVMNLDGSNLHQVSQGNNSQGESFSPDGKWIAYTAYTDVANKNQASCEIYIMRVDGTDRRRLTENGYCDYQPRWGL